MKWYPLRGVPDSDGFGTPTDMGAFAELPTAGSLSRQCVSSPSNTLDRSTHLEHDLPSEESFALHDNRSRFAAFSSLNNTVQDSTSESGLLARQQKPYPAPVDHNDRSMSFGSDSSWGNTARDLVVTQAGSMPDTLQGRRQLFPEDSDGSNAVLAGDLSVSTLQTTPNSSFFQSFPVSSSASAFRHRTVGEVSDSAGVSLPDRSTSACHAAGHHLSSSLSSSSLTNVSDLSSLAPVPQVDRLWKELQRLTVQPNLRGDTAVYKKSENPPGPACVCEQFRQLGIDTLTTLVENLNTNPTASAPSQVPGQSTSKVSVLNPTSSGLGAACYHSDPRPVKKQSQRTQARHAGDSRHAAPCTSSCAPQSGSSDSHLSSSPPPANVAVKSGSANGRRPSVHGPTLSQDLAGSGGAHSFGTTGQSRGIQCPQSPSQADQQQQCYMVDEQPTPGRGRQEHLVVLPGGSNSAGTCSPGTSGESSSSNNWYFYPLGDLYTTTSASPKQATGGVQRPGPRPTLIPLSLQDAFRQQMRPFMARSGARQHSLAVQRYKRLAGKSSRTSYSDTTASRNRRLAASSSQPQSAASRTFISRVYIIVCGMARSPIAKITTCVGMVSDHNC